MALLDPTGPPPRPDELDPVIHERVRLSICSMLAARREVDYLELRATLGVTDGNLAAHVAALERAGYVRVEKGFVGRKTRTTYALTDRGRAALAAHVERLLRLIQGIPGQEGKS